MPLRKFKIFCFALFFVVGYFSFSGFVYASTVDELNKSKEEKKEIEKEIEKLNKDLENTAKETTTLKSKIKIWKLPARNWRGYKAYPK